MRKNLGNLALILVVAFFFSSLVLTQLLAARSAKASGQIVEITLLQLNDVYEISPLGGSDQGGLARVATLRKELHQLNPNTYTIFAGDLFSPSALGTAKVDGARLAGKQMVDVMNHVGLDYATFGNHEFDLPKEEFEHRLYESKFQWISSNVLNANGRPFQKVLPSVILTPKDKVGNQVRVGLFGLTIDDNKCDYVVYKEPLCMAREQVAALRDKVDILIAVTHLSLDQDKAVAEAVRGVDLILGGHEHENDQVRRGANFVPIFKADANARSVYVHHLRYNLKNHRLEVSSDLTVITNKIAKDHDVDRIVKDWESRGAAAFEKEGFYPDRPVVTVPVELDGLETSVRNHSTNLTEIIAMGMLKSLPSAELALFNSGAVRIDDKLGPGVIKEYDVLRILPYEGTVSRLVRMKGTLLKKVLDVSEAKKGTGGYLQVANVKKDEHEGVWKIEGRPLEEDRLYKVAINNFLLEGKEKGLKFLKEDGDIVIISNSVVDIRMALIKQLKETYGGQVTP